MLPGLAQLKNTPEILQLLFEGLTGAEATWKPSPDRWSIAEVMEHLSHVEGHGFLSRILAMTLPAETFPMLPAYNTEEFSASGQYSGRNFEDSFDHWQDQRESNIEYLHTLTPDVLSRVGSHETFGAITVSDLLNEWAFHDLGHIRQIIELLRTFPYYPNMVPFQPIYPVHP